MMPRRLLPQQETGRCWVGMFGVVLRRQKHQVLLRIRGALQRAGNPLKRNSSFLPPHPFPGCRSHFLTSRHSLCREMLSTQAQVWGPVHRISSNMLFSHIPLLFSIKSRAYGEGKDRQEEKSHVNPQSLGAGGAGKAGNVVPPCPSPPYFLQNQVSSLSYLIKEALSLTGSYPSLTASWTSMFSFLSLPLSG